MNPLTLADMRLDVRDEQALRWFWCSAEGEMGLQRLLDLGERVRERRGDAKDGAQHRVAEWLTRAEAALVRACRASPRAAQRQPRQGHLAGRHAHERQGEEVALPVSTAG